MVSLSKIRNNIIGAWAVMNGQASGLQRLDLSIDGFWQSFGAIILIVPFALVSLISVHMAQVELDQPVVLTGSNITLSLIVLLAEWLAFPLVFAAIARQIGVAAHFVPFIIVRNWASVIIAAMIVVPKIFHIFGILPSQLLPYILLALFAISLRFAYRIACTALIASPLLAIPVVLLEVLLSVFTQVGFERMFG
ncbi:MAG: hypothetical protein ACTSSQ_00675 [Alphaproteobacteria bacterium]